MMSDQPDMFKQTPKWRPEGLDITKLNSEEGAVLSRLRFHEGLARAITVEEMSACLSMPDRKVRSVLKHLTEDHRIAIATAGTGCYLVQTAEELEGYLDNLKKRALSTLHRMAVLKRQHLPELLGQLSMEAGVQERE